MRSRESLKNAIMIQSGWYDDLETEVDGATQKKVNEDLNAINCRALEGGYMNTQATTYVRRSSFYVTDAISTEHFISEPRFHNNLYMATNYAKSKGLSVQEPGKNNIGLMPYQYEYDKSLKIYSITIDLEMIGKDENFEGEADAKEKADRVICLLYAIENLSLVVKGNLDNAEPIFAVGGLSPRKTHYFENVVNVEEAKLIISSDLKNKIDRGFYAGLLQGNLLEIPMLTFYVKEDSMDEPEEISMEELTAYDRNLGIGDQVIIGPDETLFPLDMAENLGMFDEIDSLSQISETDPRQWQMEWMDNYMDALEELEDSTTRE